MAPAANISINLLSSNVPCLQNCGTVLYSALHESVLFTQLLSMMPVSSHDASLVKSVVGQQDGL
jgi:hypothetical protein